MKLGDLPKAGADPAQQPAEFKLDFDHLEVPIFASHNETVLDAARRNNVAIANVCGGWGICKSCIVQFKAGTAPKPSESDRNFFSRNKLEKGWRRACQSAPVTDAQIHVPARSRVQSLRAFSEGGDIWVKPALDIIAYEVTLPVPSREDGEGDTDRLRAEILHQNGGTTARVDLGVMRQLPQTLRETDWQAKVALRNDEVIAVLPPKSRFLGVAIDLGTTNVAILLVDLDSGNTLANIGIENPQKKFGGDVISRIAEARRAPEILEEMQQITVSAINTAVAALCQEIACTCEQIVDTVIAGNTAMNHIITGLPTAHLGVSPFVATAREMPIIKARDIGFAFGNGSYVHLTDNIAGFVGGDHTAVLLGIGARTENQTIAVVDIGTNTEISLIQKGQITSLSCPSGPALEGGNISYGMRASTGAIERVSVKDGSIAIQTIENAPAIGLCGSGVLDALAAFAKTGDINPRGQINQSSARFRLENNETALQLADNGPSGPVLFTQTDIRNVQLAKGAIRAGIEVLLQDAELDAKDLDRIVIAGAFGLFVNIQSAIDIGMFPDLPERVFSQIGNGACIGAKLALVSKDCRTAGQQIAAQTRYIEQSGSQAFMKCFMAHINLPERKEP